MKSKWIYLLLNSKEKIYSAILKLKIPAGGHTGGYKIVCIFKTLLTIY